MATAEQILTLAHKELGYRESPKDSNRTKYGKWYKLDGEPWCMMFVMWIFNQAGASALLPMRTASCDEFMKAAKKAGNWRKKSDLKPGDIVIFDFPGNRAAAEHTGIVEELCDDSAYVMTIEGNTSTGDDCDGGMVMRRKRKRSVIMGAYRPAYDAERGAEEIPDSAPDADASAVSQAAPEESASVPAPVEDPEVERMLYGEPEAAPERERVPNVGDLALFKGLSQFSGPYDDAEAVPATACMTRVDAYCPGAAHPFRLYGTGIEGWADYDDAEIVDCDGDGAPCATLSLGGASFRAEITARPSLRVRSGPGVEYPYLHSLSVGTLVTIVAEQDGWGELSVGGWLSMRYVRKL